MVYVQESLEIYQSRTSLSVSSVIYVYVYTYVWGPNNGEGKLVHAVLELDQAGHKYWEGGSTLLQINLSVVETHRQDMQHGPWCWEVT